MSVLTINKLTDIGRRRGDRRRSRPARHRRPARRGGARCARGQWRAGVSGARPRTRGAGGVLPADSARSTTRPTGITRSRASTRSRWTSRRTPRRTICGPPSTGTSTDALRRATTARRRRPCCRRSRSPRRGGETEFANSYAAYDGVQRRREGAVRVAAGGALARGVAAPGHIRIRRRRCWRGGGRAPPTSIPWCGRTAAAASRWCSARRRDYVVGMDLDEGRALLAELLDRATAAGAWCTATAGRSATPSSGTTTASCIGRHRTTPTRRGRCCARRCWATNRSSSRADALSRCTAPR